MAEQKIRQGALGHLLAEVVALSLQAGFFQQLWMLLAEQSHHGMVIVVIELQALAQLLQLQQTLGLIQPATAQHLLHHLSIDTTGLDQAHRRHGLHQGEHLSWRQGVETAAIQGGLQTRKLAQLTPQAVAGALPPIGGLIPPPAPKQADGGEQQHERPHQLAAVGTEDPLERIGEPEEQIDGHVARQEAGAMHRPFPGGRHTLALPLAGQKALHPTTAEHRQPGGGGEHQGDHQQPRENSEIGKGQQGPICQAPILGPDPGTDIAQGMVQAMVLSVPLHQGEEGRHQALPP